MAPWSFFLLVYVLSIPFLLIDPIAERFLPKDIPINLPVSALVFVTPLTAASILTYRESGPGGVKLLLQRAFDYKKIRKKIWYIPILGIMPVTYLLAYGFMRLNGAPLPDNPQFPISALPISIVVFFITALCEEVGWSGYAIDRLQARWSALPASIILGAVWAILHIIPDIQAHHTMTWIIWQRLYTVVLRIVIVWLYNNTGKSVFAAICFHALDNVSFSMFPNYGSHYDPFYVWLITTFTAVIIIFIWRSEMLARRRISPSDGLRIS